MRSTGPTDDLLRKIGLGRPRVCTSSTGVAYKIGDFCVRAGPLLVNEVLKAHVLEIEFCACSSSANMELKLFEEIALLICPAARLCGGASFEKHAASSDQHIISQHVHLLNTILNAAEI
eukprot:TRINITY_DN1200_c0_g1_i3.p1 TRINITY_DN1200_c0_g1~~TRINITY_DN1200_c0_g1_i3.p1  ORF type:complete len:119 (+),score=17.74 TRINITY_DN1200_c0_g1_i3:178-534(+)